jgi:hypothetical protein
MLPKVLLPPAIPFTIQVTLVMLVLETVAVKTCCAPVAIAIDSGEMPIVTDEREPRPLIEAGPAPPQLVRTRANANQTVMQEKRQRLLDTRNSNHVLNTESSGRHWATKLGRR